MPVDFSGPSLDAVNYALAVSRHFKAELHLVHVFEPPTPLVGIAGIPLVLPEPEIISDLYRQLDEVAESHGVAVERANIHMLKGRPFEEVCRLAADKDINLIVIPTRGHAGLKHLVLGSTTERVVRYSPCPVLVLRHDTANIGRTGLAFHKIVVPIDFSPCSMQALGYARKLASEFRASLVLLHSVYLQYYVASDEYARYDYPEVMNRVETAAREQMKELFETADWHGLKIETAIESGHPGQQICDRANDRGADLIVTATHGNTGLKHVFLGSTAEYVVRHATCPVLVVPTREQPSMP